MLRKQLFHSLFCFNRFLVVCIAFIVFNCEQKQKPEKTGLENSPEQPSIFQKIEAQSSHLFFQNNLQENIATNENLFNYDYFYNGAGVGVEDINNDGLLDIFFCGNQVPNKLFINRGDFVFEDISEKALINSGKNWSNGVTFVDINNDGWMDIYVSQGGPKSREERKNLLFINQKNETFKESAEDLGLSDMGISTQSAFFDYDKDGDLDCIVMNENELYGVDPINLYRLVDSSQENQYFNSPHFYRNDNGKFVDQTRASGIQRPIFGLGLSVSDINNDGWLDFYIASDYYIPDALFINNRDGTFSDGIKEYTKHISFYGMGMDIADINNDGLQDIFVLDMAANDHVRSKTLMASMNTKRFDYLVNKAGFHHQYMYNSLQLNTGLNTFSNISQATKMANTDWSWSVLMNDFDHDQDKDVYITNGYRRYALDNDLQKKVFNTKMKYRNNVPLEIKKQLYNEIPSEKLPNILFENKGLTNFKENAREWGLNDFSFSNGCATGDFDNDGDLDLVVNNLDENCFLYKNMTMEVQGGNYLKVQTKGSLSESFAKVKIAYNKTQQLIETRRVRGYRSSQQNIAHFGLKDVSVIDTITVSWPNGKSEQRYNVGANTTITFLEKDAKDILKSDSKTKSIFTEKSATSLGVAFKHRENPYDDFEKEVLLPYKQSSLGPFFSQGDLNGDGLIDFYVGGASGQTGAVYLQNRNGTFTQKSQKSLSDDRNYEDMESHIFDWDNDGDQDLYVVSGGNEFPQYSSLYADRLYLNDGKGRLEKQTIEVLETYPKSGKTVTSLDFDKDGDQDLIIGNRTIPQAYPYPATSVIYENKAGTLIDVTAKAAPGLQEFGVVNKVIRTDFDNDGWEDLIVVGEWTGIGLFKNNNGVFESLADANAPLAALRGWWFSVGETDINNDGLPDYIIGNVGSNIKFDASQKKPFKVFANDFDENGTPDIVLSKQYQGAYVPVRGLECSSQQMPFIQQKFETYSDFANANIEDIYGDKLETGYEAEANEFKSVLLINKGNGTFDYTYLPELAQLFPVLKSTFIDIDHDGFEDVILGGNIYETEVETPRLDAFSGLVLISNGKDGYHAVSQKESGLSMNGNIKDLMVLSTQESTMLMASQNNGKILFFEKEN
ncbi:VCBS repeat-containing protein [Maribacter sp. 2307UL18-2]|uniref:VCBS repeat-containing protein n=1 Tax=Maribacter sp. 2307UL18-2 TaxID=3386274 RepID=UPI0039BCF5C8